MFEPVFQKAEGWTSGWIDAAAPAKWLNFGLKTQDKSAARKSVKRFFYGESRLWRRKIETVDAPAGRRVPAKWLNFGLTLQEKIRLSKKVWDLFHGKAASGGARPKRRMPPNCCFNDSKTTEFRPRNAG